MIHIDSNPANKWLNAAECLNSNHIPKTVTFPPRYVRYTKHWKTFFSLSIIGANWAGVINLIREAAQNASPVFEESVATQAQFKMQLAVLCQRLVIENLNSIAFSIRMDHWEARYPPKEWRQFKSPCRWEYTCQAKISKESTKRQKIIVIVPTCISCK